MAARHLTRIFLSALAAAVLGFVIFPPRPDPSSAKPAEIAAGPAESVPAVKPKAVAPPAANVSPTSLATGVEPPSGPPPVALGTAPLDWERQLAGTVRQPPNPAAKARAIFASLPKLPDEALGVAAETAIANLPDADYVAVVIPVVTDPHTHGQAMSVLFADLMERPDPIAMPALLAIARNPAHPFAASALDNLQLLLGQNHGSEWPQWEAVIARKLAPTDP
jgi:hypothetical protein